MEVEIVGATVSNGKVNVYTGSSNGVDSYVVLDRTTGSKQAITINDGIITWDETTDPASDEPIVEDNLNAGTYWKIFIDDGIFGAEEVVTVQDDEILLNDQSTGETYQLTVSDGIPGRTGAGTATKTFEFSDNGCVMGTTTFSSIDGITSSGISDGFIMVRAYNGMGQPINQEVVVQSAMPVRVYVPKSLSNGIQQLQTGDQDVARHRMMAEPSADVQEKDLAYVVSGIFGLTLGKVSFAQKIYDFDGLTHHTECELIKL